MYMHHGCYALTVKRNARRKGMHAHRVCYAKSYVACAKIVS